MKIPSCFYGTHKKVKAEVKKLYTQILKEKPPEEIFSKFELLDINDYPIEYFSKYNPEFKLRNNLIWISMGLPFISGLDHFILSAFSEPLDIGRLPKFEKEKSYEMQLKLAPFLAKTEWGCIILNNNQAKWYWSPKCGYRDEITINGKTKFKCPIDPDFALSILESSSKYWDSLISLGDRFFDGMDNGIRFNACRLACYKVLLYLGCEMEETLCEEEAYCCIQTERVSYRDCITSKDFDEKKLKYERNGDQRYFKYGNVKEICEKYSLFDKLKNDEDFRKNALEGTLIFKNTII